MLECAIFKILHDDHLGAKSGGDEKSGITAIGPVIGLIPLPLHASLYHDLVYFCLLL